MKRRVQASLLAALMTIGACAAAPAASQGSGRPGVRAWKVDVAGPAQFDLSLAQISFGAPARVARSSSSRPARQASVQLHLRGATGLDYVAAAVTRFRVLGRPRALLLVVNRRPRGSLAPDLARIGFTVSSPSSLGKPLVSQLDNPFTHPSRLTPALCNLPIRGAALTPADLRAALSRGAAPGGYSAGSAIAQAYDVVCRRPSSPAFRQAVTRGSVPPCGAPRPGAVPCCPPNAMCLPPPCPPCPCGTTPCPAVPAPASRTAIACPLATPPIACPL
ncbi:MAG TPA: hypothetical protein VGO14_00110 [Solirubrobacteraceae bacterium]|jgi:hypothetical protein|nr:hypothetical protein [Solirubrobacteraceae bacterium]